MSARRHSSVSYSPAPHSRSSLSISVFDILSAPQVDANDLPSSSNWSRIPVTELRVGSKPLWIDSEMAVEQACQKKPLELQYFDYSDIVAFLLLVLGHNERQSLDFQSIVRNARDGGRVPVSIVADLTYKEPMRTCPNISTLGDIVQIFASGVRRVAIVQGEDSSDVIEVLSQKMVLKYFWKHARSFHMLENVYTSTLCELEIGNIEIIHIMGDKKVIKAFELMQQQSVSSLAVVDHQKYLLGNISDTDVKFLTRSSSAHLLDSTCSHFLSVIKFEQGLRDGKDSAPHFSVSSSSTLAYTVAKLVATQTMRLWLVNSIPTGFACPPSPQNVVEHTESSTPVPGSASSSLSVNSATSGTLQGVVSLTDIMGIFAKTIGCRIEPTTARQDRQRRASSVSIRDD